MTLISKRPALNSANTSIKRFRQVDKNMFRGACPTPLQFNELKDRGFTTVISLRSGFDKLGLKEKELVEGLGMKYYNFPVDSRKQPSKNLVNDFLSLCAKLNSNNERVFLHCKHGRDRTGIFVALYQINNKIKDLNGAIREFFYMGYNYKKHPWMLDFVKQFSIGLK